MSKIRDYFAQFDINGRLAWPASQEAKDQLASDVLGAEIVSSLDYWVSRALDYVHNPEPAAEHRRKNVAWEREMRFRGGLESLTAEQKELVGALVAETASGALFSALVAFDQCPGIELQIIAKDIESGEMTAGVLPGAMDLHDRLYEWIDRFSEAAERYDPTGSRTA